MVERDELLTLLLEVFDEVALRLELPTQLVGHVPPLSVRGGVDLVVLLLHGLTCSY